jgi:hypothetical protein
MRKVLYLHGLESNQGGPKVEFLSGKASVHAPAMEYKTNNWTLDKLIDLINKCNPDLIIGSSMGGYFADVLGSHTGTEVLLFNPALHSRSVDYSFRYGKEGYKRTIVLGENDNVILPERTKEIVGDTAKIINIEGMGHRTLQETFQAIYTKCFIDETA